MVEMKVYRDPKANEEPILAGYKLKIVEGPNYVNCPYVPLMERPHVISECGDGRYLFRLRCQHDSYLAGAERAFRWIEANIPRERYALIDAYPNGGSGGQYDRKMTERDVVMEFHEQQDAALFKLLFL